MKRFIRNNMEYVVFAVMLLFAIICIPAICNAAEKTDTVAFNDPIQKVIEEPSVSSTGKKSIKYFILSNGYLIPTSKTVAEKIALCKKYNAKLALAAIVVKKTKKIKRIILD